METKLTILVLCVTLVSLVRYSYAVQCYECDSAFGTNKKCEDDFNKDGVPTKDCPNGCSKLKGEKDDLQYVSRGCAIAVGSDDCISQSAGGADGHYCFCKTDLCNSAVTMRVSATGLLLLVAITTLINNIMF